MYRITRRYRSGPLAGTLGTVTSSAPEAVGRFQTHTATAPAYIVTRCERTNR
jgi:hypothetical protein